MTTNTLKLLTVMIGDQLFGLDVTLVNSIILRDESTHVPQVNKSIEGLINIRGHIAMLIDVRMCLGMAGQDDARINVMIENDNEIYGLLFDSVEDITDVDPGEMEPVPLVLDERWKGMAKGIFRLANNLLIMLDPHKLIATTHTTKIGEAIE